MMARNWSRGEVTWSDESCFDEVILDLLDLHTVIANPYTEHCFRDAFEVFGDKAAKCFGTMGGKLPV